MLILHTGLYQNRILLWGEAPAEVASQPIKIKKGHLSENARKRSSPALPHPSLYDAGEERLLAALASTGIDCLEQERQSEPIIAWLPTVENKPVASSPLIDEPPALTQKPSLKPWKIKVFALPLRKVIELFCNCVGKQVLDQGVMIGKDLSFLTAGMRMAGAIVAREEFLPGVRCENEIYHAVWKPVLTGTESEKITTMSRIMPPITRALTTDPSSPPQEPAHSLFFEFINKMVDFLVRYPNLVQPIEIGEKNKKKGKGTKLGKGGIKASSFHSIHDQWMHALCTPDGAMNVEAEEGARLVAQVEEWQRSIALLAHAPFKLCFKLEEPSGNMPPEKSDWYVHYLLQAHHDPSLLIPAKDAWAAKGKKGSILKELGFNAREHLLLSLGQASGICPLIEKSLKSAAPSGYTLTTTDAYAFLTEKSLALEQSGFGIMLPAWWTRKGTKLHLSVRGNVKSPKMQGGSGISLDEMVQFDWELAIGDERLSFEELQTLAKLKVPLVKIRGQWVQMSAEEIQAALDLWKKKGDTLTTGRAIVQMALGAKMPSGALAFEGITATGWIANLLEELKGAISLEELAAPQGFQGTLRPYQKRGYSWMSFLRQWGLGACLADDMGLGKTIQTLALIQRDMELHPQKKKKSPVLLICPTSVVGNWQKEAERFTPKLKVMAHHGIARAKGEAFRKDALHNDIVISSYPLLHRDFEILKAVPWAGIILDEAQNIKNPETKQSRAARALVRADEHSDTSGQPYRIALTGTPVENNVGDLWSIMEFLNAGFLGGQSEFKKNFFIPIQACQDTEVMSQLKQLTGPFILRRLKTDRTIIDDLPEKMEMKVFCTLTKEQASLYTAVVEEATSDLDDSEGIQRKGIVLSTLIKLKQVCNHPTQFLGDNSSIPGRSGKLARITEMIEEIIEVGDRALVFTQFAEMGGILKRHLQETFGCEVLFLHGGVAKKHRDAMVERFQGAGDGPPVFIISLKAGGTGLNLTRANHVFHFDRWWNPAVENQATDRAFRIGQTKNVQVHKFLCIGTLEEKIDEMIERKKNIAQKIVGTGEGWITELSTEELKGLFALRKEAMGD